MIPRDSSSRPLRPVSIGAAGPQYDAIVVGARVAGAATAMLLARRGRRVLLVDRRRPDSDTLSTHALMRAGVLQLERWGLLDRVIAAGTPPVRRTVMYYGDVAETIEIKPKAGVEALYAPRRTVLDPILVDAAAAAGVEVRFGVTVDGLCVDSGGRVAGIAAREASGARFEATARHTVGADGIRSVVALGAGAPVLDRGDGASSVVYAYFEGDALADGYEFFYRPGMSGGFIPTNDGMVCVWAGATRARFLSELRHEPDLGFARVIAEVAPTITERLRGARRVGRLHGFAGEPSYLRQPWGPGWALVGDASHFKDPISAHGITDALRDAELLARAIVEAIDGGAAAESDALSRYHQTRDRLSVRMHHASDAVARYDWTLDNVRDLLIEMSRSMNDEVDALLSLDRPDAGAGVASVATAPSLPAAPSPPELTRREPAPVAIATTPPEGPVRDILLFLGWNGVPFEETTADASNVAMAFLAALGRRDWDGLELLLAPDVWLRALLPREMREEKNAAAVVALYRRWYGGAETRLLEAEHHTMAGREYLRYRFLTRPEFAPEQWHLVEQTGFCRIKDGRISRLDVVCTGFHPVGAAAAAEAARAA
jgi:flavin-dependent dehydrogenase